MKVLDTLEFGFETIPSSDNNWNNFSIYSIFALVKFFCQRMLNLILINKKMRFLTYLIHINGYAEPKEIWR